MIKLGKAYARQKQKAKELKQALALKKKGGASKKPKQKRKKKKKNNAK
jgi:hypothetical protein